MGTENNINGDNSSECHYTRRSTHHTILGDLGCDELTVWRVDWLPFFLPHPFSQILNDGPDAAAADGSPHWPGDPSSGPSSYSQTHLVLGLILASGLSLSLWCLVFDVSLNSSMLWRWVCFWTSVCWNSMSLRDCGAAIHVILQVSCKYIFISAHPYFTRSTRHTLKSPKIVWWVDRHV